MTVITVVTLPETAWQSGFVTITVQQRNSSRTGRIVEGPLMHKPAKTPNDLERFFVERANAGDVDGLVALYEPNATLACNDGEVLVGLDQIRKFFDKFLASGPQLCPGIQAPALCSGKLALTSSRHDNGDITAEIARRQPDGNWLWVVDQFALGQIT